jgi:hypothetical protein
MSLKNLFALDRVLRRVPSIIEVWLFEFIFIMALAMGLGRLLDGLGVGGCPPAPGSVDGTAFAFIAVGFAMSVPVLWRILLPKVVKVTWTPVFIARDLGPISHLPVSMPSATVTYHVLSSHPSYALVNLLTLPIPVVMLLGAAERGRALSSLRLIGISALVIMGTLVLLRLVCWYGLRLGRHEIAAATPHGMSAARLEWELAWQPVVAAFALLAALALIIIAIILLSGRP